jgi:agmatine deiminase
MPPEWAPHQATYLVWPHNRDTWPGKFESIPPVYARMVAAIAQFEPVRLLVNDDAAAASARLMVAEALARAGMARVLARVEFVTIATNDSWIRDFGPIIVNRWAGGERAPAQLALDFRFNSWGGKYGPADLDDAVPERLAQHYGFDLIAVGMVLEGGSIDVNGAGALLTTESCLLNPNRNAGLSRTEIETTLKFCFGAETVHWLGEGIVGDDTDGHIDDIARFADERTIVTVTENDPANPNYALLRDNHERLAALRDREGRPYRIEMLEMPPALFYEGTRLPASYANFYVVNGGVVMPTFGCETDAKAAAVLARLFPGRRVVGVESLDLVWGLGAVHCLTQQHPASVAGR